MSVRRMNLDVLEILIGDEVVISINEKHVDGEMHIEVSGEIKNEVAHDFEDELMTAFSVCPVVRLDLSKVTYIASFAMKALLSIQQIIDENEGLMLVITKISPEVKEEFELRGFLDILNVEE